MCTYGKMFMKNENFNGRQLTWRNFFVDGKSTELEGWYNDKGIGMHYYKPGDLPFTLSVSFDHPWKEVGKEKRLIKLPRQLNTSEQCE